MIVRIATIGLLISWQNNEQSPSAARVIRVDPLAVSPRLNIRQPISIRQIPINRLANARLKRLGGAPTEFALNLAGVDGVAAIMAGSVCHVTNLAPVGGAINLWPYGVEQRANRINDFYVWLLVPPANIIGFANLAAVQHAPNGRAVVTHIEPVADLHAVTLNWQGLSGNCIHNHQRNEFFRELIGAVSIAAIRGQNREAISVVPSPHKVIARCLAG